MIILYYNGISKNKRRNEQSKLRTRNWLEINDVTRGMYKDSNQIKKKIQW